MSVIGIDYNEGGDLKYNGIYFHPTIGNKDKTFFTGDFVKDWYDVMKFILTGGDGEEFHVAFSSSVHHFIGDTDLYESRHLDFETMEFHNIQTVNDVENGIGWAKFDELTEFFVEKGSTISTWDEYRAHCGDAKKS